MMSAIHEADLHAYADGQLSGARRAAVEAYLAQHPDAAAQVAAWRRQADALHGGLDPILNEPVPLVSVLFGGRETPAPVSVLVKCTVPV